MNRYTCPTGSHQFFKGHLAEIKKFGAQLFQFVGAAIGKEEVGHDHGVVLDSPDPHACTAQVQHIEFQVVPRFFDIRIREDLSHPLAKILNGQGI